MARDDREADRAVPAQMLRFMNSRLDRLSCITIFPMIKSASQERTLGDRLRDEYTIAQSQYHMVRFPCYLIERWNTGRFMDLRKFLQFTRKDAS